MKKQSISRSIKRLLAMLLSMAMIISMLPSSTAFAAELSVSADNVLTAETTAAEINAAETDTGKESGDQSGKGGNETGDANLGDGNKADQPGDGSGGNKADQPGDGSGGNGADQPGDGSGGNGADQPGDGSGGNKADQPGDGSGGNKADQPDDASGGDGINNPSDGKGSGKDEETEQKPATITDGSVSENDTDDESVLENDADNGSVSENDADDESVPGNSVRTLAENGTGSENDLTNYASFTVKAEPHVTVQKPTDGDVILQSETTEENGYKQYVFAVYKDLGNGYQFSVQTEEGYVLRQCSTLGKVPGARTNFRPDRNTGYTQANLEFRFVGKDDTVDANATVQIDAEQRSDYQLTIGECADIASVEILRLKRGGDSTDYVNGYESVGVTDNKATVSNDDYYVFSLKLKDGLAPSAVTFKPTDEEGTGETLNGLWNEVTGSYLYDLGRVWKNTLIEVAEVGDACTVTWEAEFLSIGKATLVEYADEIYYETSAGAAPSGSLRVPKGKPFYFFTGSLNEDIYIYGSSESVLVNGVKVESVGYGDEGNIYKVIPTGDMKITAKLLPYKVQIAYGAGVTVSQVEASPYEGGYKAEISEANDSVSYYSDNTLTFKVKVEAGRKLNVFRMVYDDEGNICQEFYGDEAITNTTEQDTYAVQVEIDSLTKQIGISVKRNVDFVLPAWITLAPNSLQVYDSGAWNAVPVNEEKNDEGEVVRQYWAVAENSEIRFRLDKDTDLTDGNYLKYVTTNGEESGSIQPRIVTEGGNTSEWYFLNVSEDMTVTAVSTEGVTVTWEMPYVKARTVTVHRNEFGEWYTAGSECSASTLDIGKEVPFYFSPYSMKDPDGVNSGWLVEAGDSVLEQVGWIEDDLDDGYPVYKVIPNADMTIKIKPLPCVIPIMCEDGFTYTVEASKREGEGVVPAEIKEDSVGMYGPDKLDFTVSGTAGSQFEMYYLYKGVNDSGSGEIEIIKEAINDGTVGEDNVYTIPENGILTVSLSGYVLSIRNIVEIGIVKPETKTISFKASNVNIYARLSGGEEFPLGESKSINAAADDTVSFRAEAAEGYEVTKVSLRKDGSLTELTGEKNPDDGYIWYQVTETGDYTLIQVDTARKNCAVTWDKANITLRKAELHTDSSSGPYFAFAEGTELDGTVQIAGGTDYYFAVQHGDTPYGDLLVSTDGEETGRLTPVGEIAADTVGNEPMAHIYKITPEADMKITAKYLPHTIPIDFDGEAFTVTEIAVNYDEFWENDDGYKPVISDDKKSLGIFFYYPSVQFTVTGQAGTAFEAFYTYKNVETSWDANGRPTTVETVERKSLGTYEILGGSGESTGMTTFCTWIRDNVTGIGIAPEGTKTVTFDAPQADIYVASEAAAAGELLEGGSVNAEKGTELRFRAEAKDGYEIDMVMTDISGKITGTKGADGYVWYTVEVADHMTVTVVTEEVVRKQIRIVNRAENLAYANTNTAGVTLKQGEEQTYLFDAGKAGGKFTFKLTTADSGAVPRVNYRNGSDDSLKVLNAADTRDENGTKVYEYALDDKDIAEETIIYIADASNERKVTIECDKWAMESVSAAIGDEAIEGVFSTNEDTDIAELVFAVPNGTDLNLEIQTYDVYSITRVMSDREKAVGKVSGNQWIGTLHVEEDTRVTVTTKTRVYTSLTQVMGGNEIDVAPANSGGSQYGVYPAGQYVARVFYGRKPIDLRDARIDVSPRDIFSEADAGVDVQDSTKYVFKIPENCNRKIAITISTIDYVSVKKIYCKMYLMPIAVAKYVTFSGSATEECAADTSKSYVITAYDSDGNAKASASGIGMELVKGQGISEEDAEIEWKPGTSAKGSLRVTLNPRVAVDQQMATIRFYRTNVLPGDPDYYVPIKPGNDKNATSVEAITIKSKAPVLDGWDAKITAADDISLTLQIKESADITQSRQGAQYYKIEVTPKSKAGLEAPSTITSATAKPIYAARQFSESEEEGLTPLDQTIELRVNDDRCGQAWDFSVKVSLIQTYDWQDISPGNEQQLTAHVCKTPKTLEGSTKAATYSTTVRTKKIASQIYTSREETAIAAAALTFDAGITCKRADVEDITVCSNNQKVVGWVEGGKLYVSAGSDALLGKHTLAITPIGPETMYQKTINYAVTVVKGIETLDISLPSAIYKAGKRASNVTPTVAYNKGDTAPKTKKVQWSLADEDGNPIAGDAYDANNPTPESYFNKFVKINKNSGKITINANYDLNNESVDVITRFTVKAKAADYADNTLEWCSDVITITAEKTELGELIIVRDGDGDGTYDVVARTGEKVTADELLGAYAVVVDEDNQGSDSYSEDVFFKNVKYTVNNKAIALDESGRIISVSKTVNKKKMLTATATDGSNSKVALEKLTIDYSKPPYMGLMIEQYETGYNDRANQIAWPEDCKENQADAIKFYGTADTAFEVTVLQHNDEEEWGWDFLHGISKYSLTADGAKIVKKDVEKGKYTLIATKDKVTVTLNNKGVTDSRYQPAKTYVLENMSTLTNKSLDNAVRVTANGSLIAGEYYGNQQIAYSLPEAAKGKYQYVQVSVNNIDSTRNAKKAANYASLVEYADGQLSGPIPVDEEGFVYLDFGKWKEDWETWYTNILPDSYKLSFRFGTIDEKGNFIAKTKPTAVKLKASAYKAKAKLGTAYKISAKEGGKAAMTLNNRKIDLNTLYCEPYNTNVRGSENDFWKKYFEISEEENDEGRKTTYLKLKDNLTYDEIVNLADGSSASNDQLTGWVKYSYYDGVHQSKPAYAKIKVTLKDVLQKYSLSKATMLENADVAYVEAKAGKKTVPIAHAYVTEGAFTAEVVWRGEGYTSMVGLWKNGTLVKSNKVKLYILPDGSCAQYMEELDRAREAWDTASEADKKSKEAGYAALIKKYGIEVGTTVSVKDSTRNNVKIDAKALKQTFEPDNYYMNIYTDEETGQEQRIGTYSAAIPYTSNIYGIDYITARVAGVDDGLAEEEQSRLIFTGWDIDGETGKPTIYFDMPKQALNQAVAEGKLQYKNTAAVKVTIYFVNKSKQEFTVMFTLPEQAKTFEEAVSEIETGLKKLEDVEKFPTQYWPPDEDNDDPEYDPAWEVFEQNWWTVEEELYKLLNAYRDSDVEWNANWNVNWDEIGHTVNLVKKDFVAPTATTDGSVSYSIQLLNLLPSNTPSREIVVTRPLKATGIYEPRSFQSSLDEFISTKATGWATNDTSYDIVAEEARRVLGLTVEQYPSLRLYVYSGSEEERFELFAAPYEANGLPVPTEQFAAEEFKEATATEAGYISGIISLEDNRYGRKPLMRYFKFSIDKLTN